MQYRPFGRLDWRVSALGFGMMRLPVLNGDHEQIDEAKAIRMLHHAIDQGVNYLDSAHIYHGGKADGFLGKALHGGYREKVKVATKLTTWTIEEPDDMERHLEAQLAEMQIGAIDFYLFHSLDRGRWEKMKAFKALAWAERARDDGRIKHIGFSFHDRLEGLKQIVDEYDGWELCQIQYNYLDTKYQAGTEGLRYAASKGLAVVVMEPLRGGCLADPPPAIRNVFARAQTRRTPVEWGLRWVWNQPEVTTVLSGMSTLQQVEENITSAERSGVNVLTEGELAMFADARKASQKLGWVPCTGCGYCLPCPKDIPIPDYFTMYNWTVFGKPERGKQAYTWRPKERHADMCSQCGQCEARCPQHLPIPELLPKVHAALKADSEK
jgi:uncharacterized protein